MGGSVGVKIVFVMVNERMDDVPKFRRWRKTRAKVCVNCLGVAAEYDGVLDAASNDGLGKKYKVPKGRCRVTGAIGKGVIEYIAVRGKHARGGVVECGDFGEQLESFDGVERSRWRSMEVFIALQPQRMYCSPEFGGEFLKEAGCLVFVVWFFGEGQVLMLEGDPVGGEVAIE